VAVNRPILGPAPGSVRRKALFFPVEISYWGGEDSAPASDLGKVNTGAESPLLRFSLSHFPLGRSTWKLVGPQIVPRSFCADARFVSVTQSSATAAAASRLTMNIMTGFWSGAVSVIVVARRLPSCRRFLCLTHTTVCSLVVKHCGIILWSAAPWNRQPPPSWIPAG